MQVNSISFFEHHVLEGGGEISGRSDAAAADRLRRECVMEAEVTNRTDGPLQVFICTHLCLLKFQLFKHYFLLLMQSSTDATVLLLFCRSSICQRPVRIHTNHST